MSIIAQRTSVPLSGVEGELTLYRQAFSYTARVSTVRPDKKSRTVSGYWLGEVRISENSHASYELKEVSPMADEASFPYDLVSDSSVIEVSSHSTIYTPHIHAMAFPVLYLLI